MHDGGGIENVFKYKEDSMKIKMLSKSVAHNFTIIKQ